MTEFMSKQFSLAIVTPDGEVFNEKIESLTFPSKMGEITILPDHVPLVGLVGHGELVIKKDGKESFLAVSGGAFEVLGGNNVRILADTAEKADALNLEAIEAAEARARAILTEKTFSDDRAFADASAGLERELARLKVARKHTRGLKRTPESNP